MSETKRKRVDKFRRADDKKRTVAGEMLARKLISETLGINGENITFKENEQGKPFVKNLNIEFNISHSADMVVCAVHDKPVGIDVELIRPINLTVAKRVCSDDELIYIFGKAPSKNDFTFIDNVDILTRFFEIWTAKEAYGKCLGCGLKNAKAFPSDCTKISLQNKYIASIKAL